jgi:hypothetical protein
MAELPKNIRRPSGDLVAPKRPHGRRLLLPTEVELCKLLNLSEDEYWYFLDTTAAYNGQRPKGYELIPDIQAGSIAALFTTKVLVQIGIAVVAATISYLLTPKPKEMKQGGSRRTADAIGNKKFAPQAAFDSIQELAILGDAIPLIFASQTIENEGQPNEKANGGVRVNSQLLWSQFLSLGKYQQLKVLALFSLGEIGSNPDYEGFAIGDSLLNTFNSHKVGLYFKNNGQRFLSSERYLKSNLISDDTDPFIINTPAVGQVDKNKGFSGARNPSTQVTFGAYSPVPNAQAVKLPYELCVTVRGHSKEAGWDLMRKRKKVEFAYWPARCGVIKVVRNGSALSRTSSNAIEGAVGDIVQYQVIGGMGGNDERNTLQRVYDTDFGTTGHQQDYDQRDNHAFSYSPHGVEDVDSMTISIRENVDALFVKGEQYLFGTAVMKCIQILDPVPYNIQTMKGYAFEIIEKGEIDIPVTGASLGTHGNNPRWYDPREDNRVDLQRTAAYSLSDTSEIFFNQKISGIDVGLRAAYGRGEGDLYYGHDIYTVQRVAFATVSNNRDCDVTEIGIKSKVFKQMRFANVNSQPGQEALDRAYDDRTQIQLGQVDRYLARMSFFMLQVRKIGQTTWHDMKNGISSNHTGLFAVRGNSPEFQYNTISIQQELGQFEYRFKPYPGNYFTRGGNWGKQVNLFVPVTDAKYKTMQDFSCNIPGVGGFNVTFSGKEAQSIVENDVFTSNPDWNIEPSERVASGLVNQITHNNSTEWKNDSTFNGRSSVEEWVSKGIINNSGWRIKYNDPSTNIYVPDGQYGWNLYPINGGIDARQTQGGDPGEGVGRWPYVFFIHNNIMYKPVQNAGGGHPDNKYYLFYVEKFEKKFVTPTPYFGPSSVPIDGSNSDGYGSGLHVNLTVYRNKDSAGNWGNKYHATWEPDQNNLGSDYRSSDRGEVIPASYSGTQLLPSSLQVRLNVGEVKIPVPGKNLNVHDVIKDWNIYEGDFNSNKNEPEHQISFVNEIIKTENDTAAAQYTDLAYAGLVVNSSKEWTNFSQLSAYFKQGIKIERLITSGTSSSNLFPEITYALLTNSKIGAGELVGAISVDRDSMRDAAKFCQANNFFWDGVISSKLNLRDFIFENASYCLLDFTIIGGKFSLKPTVPIKGNGNFEIDKNGKPDIKCLFTDGNINDLQVAFLSPEERQLFRAVVLFRHETVNGFPETKSVLVQSTYGSVADPIETFDLSGFCTSEDQAITFAKYAINLRRLSDHGITFKTAPQYVQYLSPGNYFRLVSEVTHTNRFRNGAKLEDGTIVSKDDLTGSEDVLYWKPGTEGNIQPSTLSQAPNGVLFTVKNTTTENKVYKCETISYGEDGLIEVAGSYAPTETNGTLSVLQNWDVHFDVKEN